MRVATMPPKKKANSQPDQGPVALQNTLSEGTDPMSMAIAVIDKKARNLEKRKVWSSQSVCLSALGQECLCKKCGQMIVCNLIVRVSGYYQMLFVQIFGKGKYSLQLVTMCTLKILANAFMHCWLYVHPCVMGANWTTKTAWLVYGE